MGEIYDKMKMYADSGKGSVATMWESVALFDDAMSALKDADEDAYKDIKAKMHTIIYGNHFDADTAKELVEQMHHTDKRGNEHTGEHYTMQDAEKVRAQYMPNESKEDVYVAINTTWHDFDKLLSEWFSAPSDQHFIKMAKCFWFEDEDYGSDKIWHYFDA